MIHSMVSHNVTQGLDMAKLHQEAIRQEIERNQQLSRTLGSQESAERRFHRMYKVRHWLHRLAPRMARAFL